MFLLQIIVMLIGITSLPIYKYTKNLWISLAIILICIVWVIYLNKKRNIYKAGISGEKIVGKILEKLDDNYIVYNDIVIGEREKGAQIDHLVLSKFGLFCIETKNMSGTITGTENDNNWTKIKDGKYEKQFYNPCKQSKGHMNAINNLLKRGGIKGIFSKAIVVFNSEKYINLKVKTEYTVVIKSDYLLKYILGQKEDVINKGDLKKIEKIIDKNIY